MVVNHTKDASHQMDIIVPSITIIVGGKTLLDNASLKLAYGRKYGLIGRNGIGKTTLLNHIARKDIDGFPQHLHVLHVEQEIDPDSKRVIDHVLECDIERLELMKELDILLNSDAQLSKEQQAINSDRINVVNGRLIEIEANTAEPRAAKILNGLGFSQEDIYRNSDEFSGGWRMRIALAKALFSNPDILLLDEPTNHLDLDAVMWLEDYVRELEITVIVVSHA